MGAVRNLFVRIGGDASGAVRGFKDASRAGANAEKSIKKSSAQTKRSIRETFASSVPSIKEYTAQIAQTKSAHQTASQNVSRLEDEIGRLTGIYDTVKNATEGLDLSKPLSELMVDAEKTLTAIESKRKKLEAELSALESGPKASNSKRTASLQAELNKLAEKSRFAVERLADLDRIADAVGADNMGYASVQGLEQLQQEIQTTKNELSTMQQMANETGLSLKSMGVGPYIGQALKGIGKTAAQAAESGVQKLWSGLKKLGSTAGHGIASLSGKLRNIGRSAASSTGGLTKMVRSIRNIGIASLGMKLVTGMFGQLRSVISSYVSQNEELSNSINAIKTQMGEALAPAINITVAALQRIMPVVTAVSNGINSMFKTLFGNLAVSAKKTENILKKIYGFDQITKESDSESQSAFPGIASGGEQSALVTKLTDWLFKLKAAFMAGDWKTLGSTFADGINSVFSALDNFDIGSKIGGFSNAVTTTLHSLLTGIDFQAIGETFGRLVTDAFSAVDWNTMGEVLGQWIVIIPSLLTGWIMETDWSVVGNSLSATLVSVFGVANEWIQTTDWLKIGESAADLIASVDWAGIAKGLFEFFGSAIGAGISLLWGFLENAATSVMDYFGDSIEAAGGNVAKGVLNAIIGIVEGLINALIGAVNWFVGGINKALSIGKKLGIDLSIPEIPEVKLPRAAKGTIVSKATNLTVGEDGAEAVVPLQRHTEWIDVLASKLAAKTAGLTGGSGGGSAIFQFYIGGRKITEYVVKDINQIIRENGVCPIHV